MEVPDGREFCGGHYSTRFLHQLPSPLIQATLCSAQVQCTAPLIWPPSATSSFLSPQPLRNAVPCACNTLPPDGTGLSSTSFQICRRLLSDTCNGSLSQINLAPQKRETHRFTSLTSQAGFGVPKHAWGFTVAILSPCRSSLPWLWVEPGWKGSTLPVSSGGETRGRFWLLSDHAHAPEASLWPEHERTLMDRVWVTCHT